MEQRLKMHSLQIMFIEERLLEVWVTYTKQQSIVIKADTFGNARNNRRSLTSAIRQLRKQIRFFVDTLPIIYKTAKMNPTFFELWTGQQQGQNLKTKATTPNYPNPPQNYTYLLCL